MSSTRIGSFSRGEWAAMQSDAKLYDKLRSQYGSLANAKAKGAYDPKNTKSGVGLSVAKNTVKMYSSNKTNVKQNAFVRKNGSFSLDKGSRGTGQKLIGRTGTVTDKNGIVRTKSFQQNQQSRNVNTKLTDNPSARLKNVVSKPSSTGTKTAKTKSTGTKSKSTGTKSKSTGTKSKSTGTKSKSTGTKNRPKGTKSKSTGTKNRPTVKKVGSKYTINRKNRPTAKKVGSRYIFGKR